MPPYILFRISCITFFIGVGFFPFVPFSVPIFGLYIALLALVVFLVFLWRLHVARIILFIAVSFIFGLFRFGISVDSAYGSISSVQQTKSSFRGVIVSEPYTYGKRQTFIVKTTDPFEARLSLWVPVFPRLLLGDAVSFQCASIQYRNGKAICSASSAELIPQKSRINPTRILGYVKSYYLESVEQWLPFPHAQLLMSILIGARSDFPRDLSKTFSSVGLSHIVAISGYNITVLIAFLTPFVRRLPFSITLRLPILVGSIALFTIFTGATSATVRAAIMGCAVLIAAVSGRRALGFQLLLAAAFFMVLYDPAILLYDRGFQLSCAATFGLLTIAPALTRAFDRISAFGGLRDIAIQTISASLATLPFIVGYFGQFSLISFFTNLLVVPLIPILMAIGFLWSFFAFIYFLVPFASFSFIDQLVQLTALPIWALLDYIITISEFFSRIPFPTLTSDSPVRTLIIIVSVYTVCAFLFFKIKKNAFKHNFRKN